MTLSDVVSLLTAVFYMLLIAAQTSVALGRDIFSFLFSKKSGLFSAQQPTIVQTDTLKFNLTVDTNCNHESRSRRRSISRARRSEGRRSPVNAEWRVAFPQVKGSGDVSPTVHERIMMLPMRGAHRKGQELKATALTQAQQSSNMSRMDDSSEKSMSAVETTEPARTEAVRSEKHPEDGPLATPPEIPSIRLILPDGQQTDDQSVIFRVGFRRLGSSALRARQPRISSSHCLRLP